MHRLAFYARLYFASQRSESLAAMSLNIFETVVSAGAQRASAARAGGRERAAGGGGARCSSPAGRARTRSRRRRRIGSATWEAVSVEHGRLDWWGRFSGNHSTFVFPFNFASDLNVSCSLPAIISILGFAAIPATSREDLVEK